MLGYKSNNHVVYSSKYHVVWCPKYRRKVLVAKVTKRLLELIYKAASRYRAEVTFILDLWLITFSNRPAHNFVSGVGRASRISRVEFPIHAGVFDLAEPSGYSRCRIHRCCLPTR